MTELKNPVIPAILIRHDQREPPSRIITFCPFCRNTHRHGPANAVVGSIESRGSHCLKEAKNYQLHVIAECQSEYLAVSRLKRERAIERQRAKKGSGYAE